MANELQRIQAHLRDLERNQPTAKRRAEVEALLGNKWSGVQVSAARVLGTWGGPESVTALRRWMGDWPLNVAALKALARCVGKEDVEWVLDLYYKDYLDGRLRSGLSFFPLIIGLPRKPTLVRLRQDAKPGSPNRKAADIALRWIERHDKWLRDQAHR